MAVISNNKEKKTPLCHTCETFTRWHLRPNTMKVVISCDCGQRKVKVRNIDEELDMDHRDVIDNIQRTQYWEDKGY